MNFMKSFIGFGLIFVISALSTSAIAATSMGYCQLQKSAAKDNSIIFEKKEKKPEESKKEKGGEEDDCD